MNKNAVLIVAIVLIALGAVGLARGHFSYTEEKHEANIGNLELSVKDKESVAHPTVAVHRRDRRRRTAPGLRPREIGTDARPTPGRVPWES